MVLACVPGSHLRFKNFASLHRKAAPQKTREHSKDDCVRPTEPHLHALTHLDEVAEDVACIRLLRLDVHRTDCDEEVPIATASRSVT